MSEEKKETITLTLDPENQTTTTVLTEPALAAPTQEITKPTEPLADVKIDHDLFNELSLIHI